MCQVVNLTENSLSHWLLFLVPFLSALKLSLKGDLCVLPCLAHSLFCSALCFSSSQLDRWVTFFLLQRHCSTFLDFHLRGSASIGIILKINFFIACPKASDLAGSQGDGEGPCLSCAVLPSEGTRYSSEFPNGTWHCCSRAGAMFTLNLPQKWGNGGGGMSSIFNLPQDVIR